MTEALNPMPLVDPVHRFILFTNAKCGGTTLKTWFFENLAFDTLYRRPLTLVGSYGPAYAVAHFRRGWRLADRAARAGRAATDSSEYKRALRIFFAFYRRAYCAGALTQREAAGYRRICVTRHPSQRLISAYLDKFCTGDPDARPPFVREVLGAMGKRDPSFRDLLDYLDRVDERACNPHWRRQTYILDRQRVDDYVRLEAMPEQMGRLAAVVGSGSLPRLRGRSQATRARGDVATEDGEDATTLSSAEIAERKRVTGRFPAAASFLTAETSERIRRLYAADFERLDYD